MRILVLGGGWSAPGSGRFIQRKGTVPTTRQLVWSSGPVGTAWKKLALTANRSPDNPAHSVSLYQQPYAGRVKYILARRNSVYFVWLAGTMAWMQLIYPSITYISKYVNFKYILVHRFGPSHFKNTGWRTKCHTIDCIHNTFLFYKSIRHLVQN